MAPTPANQGPGSPDPTPSRTEGLSGRTIIGRRERVDLPDWGVVGVRAKVDTGARTSAIHVGQTEELPNGRLRFEVVTRVPRSGEPESVWAEAPLVREARVRPSTGRVQRRPVVRTTMRLGGIDHEIELSLVCRKGMLCRMLIGRTALAGLYLVDPSAKYLVSEPRPVRARKIRGSKNPGPSVPKRSKEAHP